MHLLESVTHLALTEPEREIKVFAVSEYKIGEIGVTLNKYFQCTHPLFLIVSQAHRLDRVGWAESVMGIPLRKLRFAN